VTTIVMRRLNTSPERVLASRVACSDAKLMSGSSWPDSYACMIPSKVGFDSSARSPTHEFSAPTVSATRILLDEPAGLDHQKQHGVAQQADQRNGDQRQRGHP